MYKPGVLSFGALTLGSVLFVASPIAPETERHSPVADYFLPAEDQCSGAALEKEKSYFSDFVLTEHEGSVYMRKLGSDREYVFDVFQRFTDFSDSTPGVLACYDIFKGYRLPNTGCNVEVSPCQKKALKEMINERNH